MTVEQDGLPLISGFEILAGIALLTLSGENMSGIILGLLFVGDALSGSHLINIIHH